MKTKRLFTVLLLLASLQAFAQESLFDKLNEQDDITHITVTKTLLNMMPEMTSSVEMNGLDIKKIITKLEQIDIFVSKTPSTKKEMKKEVAAHFKSDKSYEILMKIKDEKEDVVFYGQKEGTLFKSLVMFVNNENKCVLIRLLGKFTKQDIQRLKKETEKEKE
jgi:hypothetical protein